MPAAIHVDRQPGGYTDRTRAYKVLVDGEGRGSRSRERGSRSRSILDRTGCR